MPNPEFSDVFSDPAAFNKNNAAAIFADRYLVIISLCMHQLSSFPQQKKHPIILRCLLSVFYL